MRYLLDKDVLRRCVNSLVKIASSRSLTSEEKNSLSVVESAIVYDQDLFISIESYNLLNRLRYIPEVDVFLEYVDVLYHAKYSKRWTRRLRNMNFTGEDAKMLGVATFGTDKPGRILGVDTLVTYDRHLITKYKLEHEENQESFTRMVRSLKPPFKTSVQLCSPACG